MIYDYEYMAEEIIAQIKNICTQNGVPEPNILLNLVLIRLAKVVQCYILL